MMDFKVIELETFDRADYFQYFMSVGTTIEFTSKIDVTIAIKKCKQESLNFQAYMLFKLYKTLNVIGNFKYDMLDGKLIEWEKVVPTFSSFNKQTKLFCTLYAEMDENYQVFEERYKKIIAQYENIEGIVPQGDLPSNIFNVSSIPWLHFDHFSSNSKSMENSIVKMITLGKYKQLDGKFMLPITLQVSHAIMDGYHVSMFFEEIQKELNMP